MEERSGEVVLLRELFTDPNVVGKYVRVTGYVSAQDTSAALVEISHDGAALWVDTTLVNVGALRQDALVQFIGAISAHVPVNVGSSIITGSIKLTARIYRAVDGLDMRLYEEALLARREFLSKVTL